MPGSWQILSRSTLKMSLSECRSRWSGKTPAMGWLSIDSARPMRPHGHDAAKELDMRTDTYRGATFISTDAHVTEPIELYSERLDADLRHRAPRIDTRDGWRVLVVEGLSSRKLMSAGEREVAVVGDWDVATRVKDQERDGVSAEVVFPTFALQACFSSDDPTLQLALCRAYNDWATEVLGGHHRILPVGLVPAIDIEEAIREVQYVADAGFRALFLPARVPSRPYNDAAYDPLWAAIAETGLPVTFHSGTGYEPRVVRGPGGAVINYILGAQLDGPMVLLSLAAGGAMDRFPELQVVTVVYGLSAGSIDAYANSSK